MIILSDHKQHETLHSGGEKTYLSLKLFAFEYGQNSSRPGLLLPREDSKQDSVATQEKVLTISIGLYDLGV